MDALATVYDPEIPVNITELGLIYDVLVDAEAKVGIRMTLTAPACPAAQILPGEVRDKAAKVPGVTEAKVEVVWDTALDQGSDVRGGEAATRTLLMRVRLQASGFGLQARHACHC